MKHSSQTPLHACHGDQKAKQSSDLQMEGPAQQSTAVEASSPRPLPTLQRPSMSEIVPGLFIGNGRSIFDPKLLEANAINTVISCVNASHVLWRGTVFTKFVGPNRHMWIECVDSSTQDLLLHVSRACDYIDKVLQPVLQPSFPQQSLEILDKANRPTHSSNGVLVQCDQGISRSSTIVIAYLMRKHRRGRDEVLADVREKRRVKPSANFMGQLEVWEQAEYQIWEDEAKKIPT